MAPLPLYQKEMMWRLEDARELLHAGIRENRPSKTSIALTVFSEVKDQAIENELADMVKNINKTLYHALGDLSVIRKALSKTVSEDILEQMLAHVDVGTLDLFGLKLEKMTVRTSNLLADSMIRFYDKGCFEYQKVLEPFSSKKFHSAWKRLYAHMLKSTDTTFERTYRNDHLYGDSYLFDIVNKNEDTALTAPILDVLMENQADVIRHLERITSMKDFNLANRPLNSWAVCKLYALGFSGILEASGPEVFATIQNPRQLMVAKNAGIGIEKDFVISKLLAKAYPAKKGICARMPSDAIVYALESDEFTIEDLKEIRAAVTGKKNSINNEIKHMLRSDMAEALRGVYGHERTDISSHLIEKSRFMISWSLLYTPNGFNDDLMDALIGLKHLPKTLIQKNAKLRDTSFAADLGL